MEKYEIRLCERPTLTVEEAAALYNIGEHSYQISQEYKKTHQEIEQISKLI